MGADMPYPENPGATHYEGCWRDRGHHNCAVREVGRLRAEVDLLRLAGEALEAIEARKGEDVGEWARRAAASLVEAAEADPPTVRVWTTEDMGAAVGDDVAAVLGVTHYEPAPETVSGDDAPAPAGYVPTYDVENARRFVDRWLVGTPLIVTEKIHGENWRATWRDGALHVSSRTRWKARETDGRLSHFWLTASEQVERFLRDHPGAVLFGENYGNVGGFPYDAPSGGRALRVFDVWGGPEGWWAWEKLDDNGRLYGIPRVPVLGVVTWDGDLDALATHAEGPSTLNGSHTREGAVVRPRFEERPTASPQDRAVLKLIGRDYLTGKRGKR